MRPDRTRIVQEGLFKEDPGGLPGTGHSGAGLGAIIYRPSTMTPHTRREVRWRGQRGAAPRIPMSLWRRPLSPFVTVIKAGR